METNPIIRQLLGLSPSSHLQPEDNDPTLELPSFVSVPLGPSQAQAVQAICSAKATVSEPLIDVVYGPAGSGKSHVIAASIQWLCQQDSDNDDTDELRCCYIVAPASISLWSVATQLISAGFHDFRVILSPSELLDW